MKVPGTKKEFDSMFSGENSLAFSQDISVLSEKSEIAGKTAPNRIVCQAMEGCDANADGTPGELTLRRYSRLARGGAGLIWFEASAVLPEGRANPRQLFLSEKTVGEFARAAEMIKQQGLKANSAEPLVILQLTHSGRYSKPQGVPRPLIAYNNPVFEKEPIAPENIVTDDYLDLLGEKLALAAKLAREAGFDGADIKCCHRYLLSELLSAYTRAGRYGGCFENRTRLLRETAKHATELTGGDFIVTTRLNAYDGFVYPFGFGVKNDGTVEPDFSEPIRLARELSEAGMKLINITMGNPYVNPHVNRPFAHGGYVPDEPPAAGVKRMLEGTKIIRQAVGDTKLICSALSFPGKFSANVAAAYINEGGFDMAGWGREILAYPSFASDIINNGGMKSEKCCIACGKCTEIMRAGGTPGCVVRDREIYAKIYSDYCGRNGK